jgi:uncharacterized protein (TIGR02271 family)
MRNRVDKTLREETEVTDKNVTQDEIIIPVIEEEVVIDKKIIEKGGIVIDKKITTQDISVEAPLKSDHLSIEHVAINRFLDSRPEIRYEGETMIIPVLKEVFVKRLLLVEEIRITKETEIQSHSEKITLKKEEVTIRRKES